MQYISVMFAEYYNLVSPMHMYAYFISLNALVYHKVPLLYLVVPYILGRCKHNSVLPYITYSLLSLVWLFS